MKDNKQPQAKSSINIGELIQNYRQYWWWFAISVVVCMGLAFAYSFVKKPVFTSKASVLIVEESGGSSEVAQMFSVGNLLGTMSTVDDELLVMTSHSVMKQTVKDLNLQNRYTLNKGFLKTTECFGNTPIEIFYDPSLPDTLSKTVKFEIKVNDEGVADIKVKIKKATLANLKDKTFPVTIETPYGTYLLNKTERFPVGESFKMKISVSSFDGAAESLSQTINGSLPKRNANMIELSRNDKLPRRARKILDTLIANYNNLGVNEKQEKGQRTVNFINERLKSLASELETSDSNIETYKREHNLTDINAEATYQLQRKSVLEDQLTNSESEFEVLKLTRDFINDPENKYSLIPTPSGTNSATEAIRAYNELILERMRLENSAKGGNVAMRQLNEQIDAMRNNIAVTLNKTVENAKVRLDDLRAQARISNNRLGQVPTQEREYINLMREHSIKEQIYIYLLREHEETALAIANANPRGMVIDEAYTLGKVQGMSRSRLLIIGFILGMGFPIGILYLLNLIRTKFKNRHDLEKLVKTPIIGEVNHCHKGDNPIVVRGSSSAAELFRYIRSNLQFVLAGKEKKTVVITSTRSGEGKTFISVNLAVSLAMLGKKVVIIGADIRKPQLAQYFNVPTQPGLTQYLSDYDMTVQDIIQSVPGIPDLSVIVAGPVPPNPSELLAGPRVGEIIDKLRDDYDYIIIDSAPVGMVSDTFGIDEYAEATIYVVRANYTTFNDIDMLNKIYEENRLRNMAIVVNDTRTARGYGYGYGYGEEKK